MELESCYQVLEGVCLRAVSRRAFAAFLGKTGISCLTDIEDATIHQLEILLLRFDKSLRLGGFEVVAMS
jgi:hypothetical protein